MNTNTMVLIQLGECKLYLIASPLNYQYVLDVQSRYPQFATIVSGEMDNSYGRLFVLSAVELDNSRASLLFPADSFAPKQFFIDLVNAYRNYNRAHSLGFLGTVKDNSFFSFARPLYGSKEAGEFYRGDREREAHNTFYALVIEEHAASLYIRLLLHLLFIAACWHVERGGLYLHSSAVWRSADKGFLFLGASGNGKTTVATLSVEAGYGALGDDLNFVVKQQNGYKLAAAPSIVQSLPGYSMVSPSLRGIFRLVKDDYDELKPIPPLEISKYLLESLKQIPKASLLTDETFQRAFSTVASIARCVPGYELHFRKTKDFWNLIDKQFPD